MSMKPLVIQNPANHEILAELAVDSAADIASKAVRARLAQPQWAARSLDSRMAIIEKFRAIVARDLDRLAATMTRETGKPIAHSRNELNGFLGRIDFFLGHSKHALAPQTVFNADGMREEIHREPLGLLGNISAWNYPWFVGGNVYVPGLLTGNSILYKPSEYASLSGLAMRDSLYEAGVPEDIFIAVIGAGDAGTNLLAQPINGLFFTGSVATGRAIAKAMGSRFVKLQLELGGKDPTYVCADANALAAADSLADGAMYNAGQSCCSVERIYVHESIHEAFVGQFVRACEALKLGDPLSESTTLGPLTRAGQIDVLNRQVSDARAKGARILLGGSTTRGPFDGKGNWYAPTVITDTSHEMLVMTEESFGPIIGIQKVSGDDEAIRLMNDTTYGLTAGVYTPNESRARQILARVNAGSVYWNCCDRVSPRLPWSGRGDSGVGLTLSEEGITTFTQPKAWHLRSA